MNLKKSIIFVKNQIMDLYEIVASFFSPDGFLSRLKNFEYRETQHEMAKLTAKMLDEGGIYLIEAGTGTGKTFAYLIPAIFFDKRVVISTKTKNLQEQIFYKDLKLLKEEFSIKPNALIIKGRNNYICLRKLNKLFQKNIFQDETVEIIKNWAYFSETGDINELNELSTKSHIINLIVSNSDTCFGVKCEYFKSCFINKLRIKAEKSDILVVNHHLLFSDLKVKSQGFGKVLPEYKYLICDEAHSIEDISLTHFGQSISKYKIYFLISEIEEFEKDIAKNLKNLANELFSILKGEGRVNLYEYDFNKLQVIAGKIIENFQIAKETIIEESLIFKIDEIIMNLDKIFFEKDLNFIKWVEFGTKNVTIYLTPQDLSDFLENFFYSLNGVLFTSATLSINESFDFIKTRLGLKHVECERIFPSLFDFKKSAVLFIPDKISDPFSENFVYEMCNYLIDLINYTKGNALLLFTSFKNMFLAGEILKKNLNYSIFIQGESSNFDLLQNFKNVENSILLGSYSFWEGIDIEPENLKLVAIDKLPFSPPTDPVKYTRIEILKDEGKNPFIEYQLPEAIMFLKQGFGRLIRSKKHKGILALFDKRILTKSYGKVFLKNLPNIEIVTNISKILKK